MNGSKISDNHVKGFLCMPPIGLWMIHPRFVKLFQSQYNVRSESNVAKICQTRDFKNVELLNVFMSNLKCCHISLTTWLLIGLHLCIGIHNIAQCCTSKSWAMEYKRGYESCSELNQNMSLHV